MSVIEKMIKQRRDSIEQFQRVGRQDLVGHRAVSSCRIAGLHAAGSVEAEVVAAVAAAIQSSGAKGMADMAQGHGCAQTPTGRACRHGKVSALVKAKLSAS